MTKIELQNIKLQRSNYKDGITKERLTKVLITKD